MKPKEVIEKEVEKHKKLDEVLGMVSLLSPSLLPKVETLTKAIERIDLQVVTFSYQRDYKEIRHEKGKNLEINIYYYDLTKLYRLAVIKRDPGILRTFSKGEILFDKTNHVLKSLKILCKAIYDNGPWVLNENAKLIRREKLKSGIDQIKNAIESSTTYDEAHLLHQMTVLYLGAIKIYFEFNRLWLDPDEDLLDKIKDKDNFLYKLIREYLESTRLKVKISSLDRIAKYILEPFGGYAPDSWQTPVPKSWVSREDLKAENFHEEKSFSTEFMIEDKGEDQDA